VRITHGYAPRKTQLVSETEETNEETIYVHLKSREELKLDKANLLSRLAEIWGEVPIRFLQHLDLRKGVFGLIGMLDSTMFPILRPGSMSRLTTTSGRFSL
jgi:hypothetical protein